MRNQLIHAYFYADHTIVWSTIQVALSDLIPKIEAAISHLAHDV